MKKFIIEQKDGTFVCIERSVVLDDKSGKIECIRKIDSKKKLTLTDNKLRQWLFITSNMEVGEETTVTIKRVE